MFDLTSKVWTCFYTVRLRYNAVPNEGRKERDTRRTEERAKLKAAGFGEDLYYRFPSNATAEVKAAAKKKADAQAKLVAKKSGVVVEVVEGTFL